ncbi:MAG: AMP-binding protein [Bacteroidia bacterium]|nr:AMP-binding protein [Bacteroidia bacterium]
MTMMPEVTLSRASARRLIISLLREISPRLSGAPHHITWSDELDLRTDVGLDSLEILDLAGRLHGMFDMLTGDLPAYLPEHTRLGDWISHIVSTAGRDGRPVRFLTSGSEGTPRICPHTWTGLMQEAIWLDALLGSRGHIFSLVPAQHLYGFLFTQLLPDAGERPCTDVRDTPLLTWWPRLGPDDWVVATPTLWQHLDESLSGPWPLRQGVSSSAPMPPALAERLRSRGMQLTEVYGSSETAGMAVRTQPGPYELMPWWTYDPASGQLVRILEGQVCTCEPPDTLVWHGERSLEISGRRDHAVQIGGVNVYPARIAAQLAALPWVAQCWVRPMHPAEGHRLKAWIIPADPAADMSEILAQAYAWVETHLPPAERPRHIRIAPEPPYTEMGKVSDWPI